VLPCVYVFIADEFCVWATILRTCLALRCGAQFVDVPMCLALHTCLPLRLGAHLADAPFVALGRPTSGRALRCWGTQCFRCGSVFRLGAHLADSPCVAFGHPSCGRASHCVGAPNLGEAVLKSLPPSQNLFLSILQVIFSPSAPFCGRFRCG
jgi:hypothetical protein